MRCRLPLRPVQPQPQECVVGTLSDGEGTLNGREKRISRGQVARILLGGQLALLLLSILFSAGVQAHATAENYVWVNVRGDAIEGRFEIRLDDLRTKLGLDLPADFEAARGAVSQARDRVEDYLRTHFAMNVDGVDIPIEFTRVDLFKADALGHFAQFFYRSQPMQVPDRMTVRNTLFFEDDPFHRSLLLIEYDDRKGKEYGGEFTALVFSPTNSDQEFDFDNIRGLISRKGFVWQGMLHIWAGIDHVLFLVALLIPVALVRKDQAWIPVDRFGSVFWKTIKIVTVFTIAHSITLALAALQIVQLPSRIVESVIALSIILVALNNIFPRFRSSTLPVIFAFGLFHGLGFASVMGDLPFRMVDLVWTLVAFNVGVEIGQIVIVALVVPLLFWLREQYFYKTFAPSYGSALLVVVAGFWFFERALGLSL